MLYCMEYLEENFAWLQERLQKLGDETYVVFDLPGQVELSTNHSSLRNIIERLQRQDWRVGVWCLQSHSIAWLTPLCIRQLVAIHLTDATHITDASRYVSLLLLSLRAMLMLELPHINVLSKIDLLADHFDELGAQDRPLSKAPLLTLACTQTSTWISTPRFRI